MELFGIFKWSFKERKKPKYQRVLICSNEYDRHIQAVDTAIKEAKDWIATYKKWVAEHDEKVLCLRGCPGLVKDLKEEEVKLNDDLKSLKASEQSLETLVFLRSCIVAKRDEFLNFKDRIESKNTPT